MFSSDAYKQISSLILHRRNGDVFILKGETMIDSKQLRHHPDEMIQALKKRGFLLELHTFLTIDQRKRKLLNEAEEKKNLRNTLSKKLGIAKKNGSQTEYDSLMEEIRLLNQDVELLDKQIDILDTETDEFLRSIPNPPAAYVPDENTVQKELQNERVFLWEPKTYQEITDDLQLSFPATPAENIRTYTGLAARLERALLCFLLDIFSASGFVEVALHSHSSIDSLYQDCIFELETLSVGHCALCDAAAGQLSLAAFSAPETSHTELENLSCLFEKALTLLALPYRIVVSGAKTLDFTAAEASQIEVWFPGTKRFEKAAVFFNHEAFLSRRSGIRFRTRQKEKPQYAHTLSGIIDAGSILLNAILENNQNEDGTVSVPEALIPYIGAAFIR